ncbi:hypothetical protein GIB67_012540, partial [Kingdonia uniflora]
NFDKNDDGRILGDGGGIDDGVGSPIRGGVGGGLSQREHIEGQNEDISRFEEEISNLKLAKEVADLAKLELLEALKLKTDQCKRLKESNDRLQADLQGKQDLSKTEKKLNDKNLECNLLKETNKKLLKDVCSLKNSLADLNVQLEKKLNFVLHSEANVVGVEDWKQKYDELSVKYEEAQRKLSERDKNGVWRLTLKGAIEEREGDFQDPDVPTWVELAENGRDSLPHTHLPPLHLDLDNTPQMDTRAPQLSAGFLCSNLFKNVTSAGGTTQAITTTFALKVGEMSDIMETDSGVHTS